MYFYHFTNIEKALGIIEKGWIFGRHEALENNLMQTENASPSVISVSQNKIKEYARLYFRPRTPTQYHNEGYKPKHIRNKDVNANCPLKQAVQVRTIYYYFRVLKPLRNFPLIKYIMQCFFSR